MLKHKLFAALAAAGLFCTSIFAEDVFYTDEVRISGSAMKSIQWKYNEELECYSAEKVVFCKKPSSSTTQIMNIYVPESYVNPDGSVNKANTVTSQNGAKWTGETAPVVYLWGMQIMGEGPQFNKNQQKMPGNMGRPDGKNGMPGNMGKQNGKMPNMKRPDMMLRAIKDYLKNGYVVAVPTVRTAEADTVADLKAGVAFLKTNDNVLPGNSKMIVAMGMGPKSNLISKLEGDVFAVKVFEPAHRDGDKKDGRQPENMPEPPAGMQPPMDGNAAPDGMSEPPAPPADMQPPADGKNPMSEIFKWIDQTCGGISASSI